MRLLWQGGGVELRLDIDFGIRGELCLEERSLTLTLVPMLTLKLSVDIFAIVAKILKGGIKVTADLVKISFEPSIAFLLKTGFAVGGRLMLVIHPIEICLEAYVDIFFLEFCDIGESM